MKWLIAAAVLLSAGPRAMAASKLVYHGWGAPETSSVRGRCAQMEQTPLDGTSFVVALDRVAWARGRTDTTNQLGWNVFGRRPLDDRALWLAADDLQRCHWTKLTENFLPVSISSTAQDQRFSWTDDRRWTTVAGNWRTFVTVARRAGCRGIVLDPEHYGARFFNSSEMLGRSGVSRAELDDVIAKRGQALMTTLAEVFPDAVVLMLYGHSIVVAGEKPVRQEYDLYPTFLDGMLRAAPGTVRMVDGFEFAYGFRTHEEFEAGRGNIQSAVKVSRVPDLYRQFIRAGFGLWLDYDGPTRWSTKHPERNFFTPAAFEHALTEALRMSDGYVWVYSQRPGFFPPRELPRPYLDAMRAAREAAGGSVPRRPSASSNNVR